MWTSLPWRRLNTSRRGGAAGADERPHNYGLLGAPRPDAKYSPADSYVLASTSTASRRCRRQGLYSVGMEVTDSAARPTSSRPPRPQAQNSLGGKHLPGFVSLQIGLDQPPGA